MSEKNLCRVGLRRLTKGVQIGALRLFWDRNNWRSKPHPYWYARNWSTSWTVQSGPVEIWYHKSLKRPSTVFEKPKDNIYRTGR